MTLTYAVPNHDRAAAVHDFQKAVKRLVRAIGPVRYVAVIEEHPGGHGIHWHVAFDRFIQKETLARCWGLGFVDARRIKHAHGNGGSQAGRYLAKYLTKDVGCSGRSLGGKRYLVSTGLDVHPHVERFHTLTEAETWCRRLMGGGAPVHVWDSGTDPDWRGPPCTFAMW